MREKTQPNKRQREDILRIHRGCQICGTGTLRWTYNSQGIFGLHACLDCYEDYKNNAYVYIQTEKEIAKEARKQTTRHWWFNLYETKRLQREYVRNLREARGVTDPLITCRSCKQKKSVFEFKAISFDRLWPNDNVCYYCRDESEYTKTCPRCNQKRDIQEFEDDEWLYKFCCSCRDEIKIEKFKKLERSITFVADWECQSSLKRRGIAPTIEAIETIRAFIIAKRIDGIFKSEKRRQQYESDYAYVYGKQPENEKDFAGRIQAGGNIVSTKGI